MSGATAAWLPDARLELLLGAALAESPAEASAAWSDWRRRCTLEGATRAEAQTFPLLYRNLRRLEVDDPELDRLKGAYRYCWSRNQMLLKLGRHALETLREAGIATIVLKGAALSTVQYRDLGVRPMTDFDVLVPRASAGAAIEALARALRPHEAFPHPDRRLPVHHSTSLVDSDDNELDLHWYSLFASAPDHELWSAAVPAQVAGAETRVLCPPDQLLQVCGHGAWWTPAGSARWVADAVVTIRSAAGSFDWERLVSQSRKRRLSRAMVDPLEYLRVTFGVAVPDDAIEQLRSAPESTLERRVRRYGRAPRSWRGIVLPHLDRYQRLRRLDPAAPRAPSFLAHLRAWWGFETYRGFARHTARLAMRDLRTARPLAERRRQGSPR